MQSGAVLFLCSEGCYTYVLWRRQLSRQYLENPGEACKINDFTVGMALAIPLLHHLGKSLEMTNIKQRDCGLQSFLIKIPKRGDKITKINNVYYCEKQRNKNERDLE